MFNSYEQPGEILDRESVVFTPPTNALMSIKYSMLHSVKSKSIRYVINSKMFPVSYYFELVLSNLPPTNLICQDV